MLIRTRTGSLLTIRPHSQAAVSTPVRRVLRTIVLAAGVFVAVLAIGAGPASAKACWTTVVDDWYDNNRLDGVYSQACLREAINKIPDDLRTYTNIEEVIRAYRIQASRAAPPSSSTEPRSTASSGGERVRVAQRRGSVNKQDAEPAVAEPRQELFKAAFDKIGPREADSVPLPLLILAGLAMLLIAAGAAGVVSKRLKTRRVPTPPAP